MARYRVLSLDGGGLRGVVTAVILQRLSNEPGLSGWLDRADLFAGTSTGGLVALALAEGLSLSTVIDLYVKHGPDIFDDSWLDDVLDIGRLVGAEYSNRKLRRELKKTFGETRLRELKRKVVIPSFDLDNEDSDPEKRTWKPKVFHNFPGADTDGDHLVYEVGLYTSAAPTYFPSVDGYIDGGVYANNPSMCALAQTQDPRTGGQSLSEVVLLSLGTGTSLTYVKGKTLDWGYGQWAAPLVNLMLDGNMGIADYQCKQILRDRYHRLAPTFPADVKVPLDDVARIPYMVQFAQGLDLKPTVKFLKEKWLD